MHISTILSALSSKKGYLYCILSGIFWGTAGCCGQFLFDSRGWSVDFMIPVRISVAGIVVLLIAYCTEGPDTIKRTLQGRRNLLELISFGVLGIGLCQYSYYVTISESNAATATILCYLSPIFIIFWMALRTRHLPVYTEVISVVLAMTGTFFLATHGDITTLVMSEKALLWGIISAISTAVYTIQPKRLTAEYGTLSTTGLGMVIGAVFLLIVRQPWMHVEGVFDLTAWAAFAVVTLIGSAFSFTLFFCGMRYIGPTKASILCATEPLSSTILSVFWLQVVFVPMDFLGFLLIFSTIFILAIPVKRSTSASSEH